jgi:hypothetical protein
MLFLPDVAKIRPCRKILLKIQNTKLHRIRHLRVVPFRAQADAAKLVVAYETALRMLVMIMMMIMTTIGIIIFYDLHVSNDM